MNFFDVGFCGFFGILFKVNELNYFTFCLQILLSEIFLRFEMVVKFVFSLNFVVCNTPLNYNVCLYKMKSIPLINLYSYKGITINIPTQINQLDPVE